MNTYDALYEGPDFISIYDKGIPDKYFIECKMEDYFSEAISMIKKKLGFSDLCYKCISGLMGVIVEAKYQEQQWAIDLIDDIGLDFLHIYALLDDCIGFEREYQDTVYYGI